MLTIAELRSISASRIDEAQALLDAGHYDGVVYLCGYAVELALKARICETLSWAGYPYTNREFRELQSFRTHNLRLLLRLSGQDSRIKGAAPMFGQMYPGGTRNYVTWFPAAPVNHRRQISCLR